MFAIVDCAVLKIVINKSIVQKQKIYWPAQLYEVF